MFVHGLVNIFVHINMSAILEGAGSEVRSGGSQCPTGEVVLVIDAMRGLVVMGMVMGLLCGVGVMALRLELGDLHAKSLVGLAAIHHDMLPLVGLCVHCEGIQGSSLADRR